MSKRKPKPSKPGSDHGSALANLRWACSSEAERKAVGRALVDARKAKAEKG